MDNAQLAGAGVGGGGECAWRLTGGGWEEEVVVGTSTVKPHLQWIVKAPVVVPRPRQEGGGDGRPCGRGDVEEGVAGGAGGRAAEGRRRDTGEVDAQRESGLLQSFLWHSEGLQLLLSISHVGVLAATADTIQTRLGQTIIDNNVI